MKDHFSSMAFLTISPIMQAVYNHPFTVEMIDGILPREKFLAYLQQDSLHLVAFSRALALVAARLRSPRDVSLLLYLAEQVLIAERELHEYYFKKYQITPTDKKSPACFALGTHLLERAALGVPAEAMAALLPCFWISREAGGHARKLADADNPYFQWIERYSGNHYALLVDKAVAVVDHLAGDAGPEELQSMMNGFIVSAHYEYGMRDDAHALRSWPA